MKTISPSISWQTTSEYIEALGPEAAEVFTSAAGTMQIVPEAGRLVRGFFGSRESCELSKFCQLAFGAPTARWKRALA